MNEVLGIIIPMLMSGADIMDIVRALGRESSAAGMDGLEGMMRTQVMNARRAYPLVQNQATINRAAENIVEKLGGDPYSGIGQGLSSLIGNLYHVAPDIFGTIMGIPNGDRFFGTIANGAGAINQAAGLGSVDMFNPYSVMSAHANTVKLARRVYDMGVKRNGGYDISFGHGLNMGEMGQVAQRLLSSELAYLDENGRRLDISSNPDGSPVNKQDAEKFNTNLRKLGSKFNEAASMLAKMTGSVEEALKVMDQMSGGNFLGGTAEHAQAVAQRARTMAANIRITAAMAGITPQEAYSNMAGLQQTMAVGSGMNQYIAGASGYSSLMHNMAFNGTMAFNMWAAMNPNASPEQRAQALLAANGRATRYANSSGAALAAAVADNRHLFSDAELQEFEASYREGRPESMVRLIRERIGDSAYHEYMNNPAMQIAARARVAQDETSQAWQNRFDNAGQEGNLMQAEIRGNRRLMNIAMRDMDASLGRSLGVSSGDLYRERREAVAKELREMAVKDYDLTESMAAGMNVDDLRKFLSSRPGMDAERLERVINTKTIEAAERQIDDRKMSNDEERAARSRLISVINSSTDMWGDDKRRSLTERLEKGEDLSVVFKEFADNPVAAKDRKRLTEMRDTVFAGKMTESDAEAQKAKFSRLKDSQRIEYSAKERMDAIENDVKRSNVQNAGLIKGLAASEGFGDLADKFAISRYEDKAVELAKKGRISIGSDRNSLTEVYEGAAKNIVSKVIGDSIGGLDGDSMDEFKQNVASSVVNAVRNGTPMNIAFADAIGNLSEIQRRKLGVSGIKRINKLASLARDENSDLVRNSLNRGVLLSESTKLLEGIADNASNVSGMSEMRSSAEALGKKGLKDDRSALYDFRDKLKQFYEEGKISFKADNEKISKMYAEGANRMVSKVLGGDDKRLGNLEGKEFEKFAADVSGRMMDDVYKNGSSLGAAFAKVASSLTDDQIKAIGGVDSAGMKEIRKMAEMAQKGNLEGLSRNDMFANVVSVADSESKQNRLLATGRMRDLLEGKFGGSTDKEATNLFFELSKSAGVFRGSEGDVEKMRKQGISSYVSDSLRRYGFSSKEIKDIGESAAVKFDAKGGGDYGDAIASAMREHADTMKDGARKSALLARAEEVEKSKDVGKSVLGNVLSEMRTRGSRRAGFAAMAQSANADIAGLIYAASMTGVSFDKLVMNQLAPSLLSAADASVAGAQMNKVTNALQIGSAGGLAKSAIEGTEKQIADLGEKLKKVDISTIRTAFSDTGEKGKAAMAVVEGAIGKDTPESKQRMRLLRTLNEGYKIGDKDALEVMKGGEKALGELKKAGSTDMDVLEITRQTNRKDSDAYNILDTIGGFAKQISGFFQNPLAALGDKSIPVTVTGGKVNTNLSLFGN